MKLKILYKGKKIILENVKKCSSFFSKLRGLMFGNDKNPLIFTFDKPGKYGIHSFFVRRKFLAIWLLKGKVIDGKIVRPWRPYVLPKSKFDAMIEIPFESTNEISDFLDDKGKGLNTS